MLAGDTMRHDGTSKANLLGRMFVLDSCYRVHLCLVHNDEPINYLFEWEHHYPTSHTTTSGAFNLIQTTNSPD